MFRCRREHRYYFGITASDRLPRCGSRTQKSCFSRLTEYFSKDERIYLVKKAVGSSGKSTLLLSPHPPHSSLDPDFIKTMRASGRFFEPNDAEQVGVTTLDQLLVEFGIPFFISIDVEGFEVTDKATGEVSISHHLAQTMDVFLGLIEDGVTKCSEIAEEMKTSRGSVSRLAKQAIKAGKIKKEGREYVLVELPRLDSNQE